MIRMCRLIFVFVSYVIVAVCMGGCGDDDNGTNSHNRPPEILSVTADPDTFYVYGSTTITVTAEDPDGDALHYNWDFSPHGAPLEFVSASGNTAKLKNCCWIVGPVNAWAISIVDDGRGGVARDSVSIVVLPEGS